MPIRTWIRSTMEDEGNFSRRLGVVPKGSGGGGQKVGRFFCVMTNGGAGAFKLAVLALKRSFKPSLVIPAQF